MRIASFDEVLSLPVGAIYSKYREDSKSVSNLQRKVVNLVGRWGYDHLVDCFEIKLPKSSNLLKGVRPNKLDYVIEARGRPSFVTWQGWFENKEADRIYVVWEDDDIKWLDQLLGFDITDPENATEVSDINIELK